MPILMIKFSNDKHVNDVYDDEGGGCILERAGWNDKRRDEESLKQFYE